MHKELLVKIKFLKSKANREDVQFKSVHAGGY